MAHGQLLRRRAASPRKARATAPVHDGAVPGAAQVHVAASLVSGSVPPPVCLPLLEATPPDDELDEEELDDDEDELDEEEIDDEAGRDDDEEELDDEELDGGLLLDDELVEATHTSPVQTRPA